MIKFFTLNTTIEAICLVIAILCLRKDSNLIWRGMILFLFITCITEMIAIPIKIHYKTDPVHIHPNIWLYNVLLIFQAGFISLMFQRLLSKYSNCDRIIGGGVILLIILYIYEISAHGIFVYNNITNTIMSVQFVIYCYYYYYCLLKDDAYVNLAFSADFWWVAGALFFYFGRTACNIFFDILSLLKPDIVITYPIYKILNVILYTYWSYSFICRKWLISTSKIQFQ
jgi:hypothetical protein